MKYLLTPVPPVRWPGHDAEACLTFSMLVKRPGALLPIAMSLAALLVVLGRIALFGTAPDPDEGTAAHLFQLLMVAQLPLIAIFAVRWLPKHPAAAVQALALQVLAALMALAPVFLLGF